MRLKNYVEWCFENNKDMSLKHADEYLNNQFEESVIKKLENNGFFVIKEEDKCLVFDEDILKIKFVIKDKIIKAFNEFSLITCKDIETLIAFAKI